MSKLKLVKTRRVPKNNKIKMRPEPPTEGPKKEAETSYKVYVKTLDFSKTEIAQEAAQEKLIRIMMSKHDSDATALKEGSEVITALLHSVGMGGIAHHYSKLLEKHTAKSGRMYI